ncbi:MAG: tetratricopeptide repeat protein [Actinomycetota bacterium]|nr:tetratricopeptide repeat protein [Actinomycetota bacterium]
MRELKRSAKDPVAVAKALTLATEAIEAGEPETALPYLEWAKSMALRSPNVREALGVARYLAGDWSGALLELQAYRRFTGRKDQNHLIADSLRGLGRPPGKMAELVREMDVDRDGPDRLAEGAIVWASALADHGDPGAGRAVLHRYLEALPATSSPEPYELRMWYVAGDLAERDGDPRGAEQWFRRLARVGPRVFDVTERLAALES